MSVLEIKDVLDWLRVALDNQKDNVKHGSSKKFACLTKDEIENSLKAINGMHELLNECENRFK